MSKQAQQVEAKVTRILGRLGFKEAEVGNVGPDRAVIMVETNFPTIRKAFSRQYGNCHRLVPRKSASWNVEGKGTIIMKAARKGAVKVTFTTSPAITS